MPSPGAVRGRSHPPGPETTWIKPNSPGKFLVAKVQGGRLKEIVVPKYTIECKPHLSADPHWYWDSKHATFLGAWLTLWSRRWSGGGSFSYRLVDTRAEKP